MDNRTKYRAAALFLRDFVKNEGALCECLALLQQIPEAGPIFSAIEKADEALTHALQFLYKKAEGNAAYLPDPVEVPAEWARRWSWRPPGENPA